MAAAGVHDYGRHLAGVRKNKASCALLRQNGLEPVGLFDEINRAADNGIYDKGAFLDAGIFVFNGCAIDDFSRTRPDWR